MGAIGAVLALVSLISTIGYLAHSWKVQIETNYAVRLEARLTKQKIEYQQETSELTTKLANIMRNNEITALNQTHDNDKKILALTSKLERMTHEEPFKASNLYQYYINRIMCLIAGGSDTASRDACNRFETSTANYSPPIAAFISVTRETTDYWNEQCDEGKITFCDYSIMGLTQSGAKDLLLDLEKIDYYQLRLNFGEEARIEALITLRDLQLKLQPK